MADEVDYEILSQRLQAYDRQELRQILMQRLQHRQDITSSDLEPILDALEATRDAVLLKFIVVEEGEGDPEEPALEAEVISAEESIEVTLSPAQAVRQAGVAATWSTWDQVKWNPAAAQQSTLSALSWSTWSQLSSKSEPKPTDAEQTDSQG